MGIVLLKRHNFQIHFNKTSCESVLYNLLSISYVKFDAKNLHALLKYQQKSRELLVMLTLYTTGKLHTFTETSETLIKSPTFGALHLNW